MSRLPRIVVPGASHHVTQRGNDRQAVFFCNRDYQTYMDILLQQSQRYRLQVTGYCLMPNHVHIIGIPENEKSLSLAVGRCNYHYTQYINKTYDRKGHLWQARFYSCVMDAAHAHNGMAYVELNPVRAGLVRKPWRYRWSSAAAHCEGKEDAMLAGFPAWRREYSADQWRETLRAVYRCGETSEVIREHTRTGRPLGSEAYLEALEQRLGTVVRAGRVGRPRDH